MTYLSLDFTIVMVLVLLIPVIGFLYLLIPVIFLILEPREATGRTRIASKLFHSCINERRLSYALAIIYAIIIIFTLILSFEAFVLRSIDEYFRLLVHDNAVRGDFDKFIGAILIISSHSILPISTVLIALLWYTTELPRKLYFSASLLALWFIPRIALVAAMFLDYPSFVIDPNSLVDDHLFLVPATFGGIAGLLVCAAASITGFSIIWLIMSSWRIDVKFVASVACLCPLVVLIFGVFELTLFYVSIDFAITAVTLGWLMSTTNRPECVQTDDRDTDIVMKFPDNRDEELVAIERLVIRFRTYCSRFGILAVRAGVFMVVTVIPAIILKWVSQDMLGLRLDGSVGSWSTIWAIALAIGLMAFSLTSLYERRDRAQQVAVVAFLCAFAIMIFNLTTEYDSDLSGYRDVLGLMLTLPILILGTLSLILTVVLDNQRWAWPFWACWIFIYIFVHAFAGSRYVEDVTKLDLFSWINLSVIVFVFLFAIPAYFASDRCQRQTIETTQQ